MMEKRLKIAKRLLNPKDSVLIVTIDEKEYLHLGMLLVMSSGARVHNCIISGNLSGDGTDSNYLGNGSSFSYCLSSSAAPSGGVECIVGTPVFRGSRPLCLDRSSPGRSQGSVVGYEDLLTAKDFFGNRRVKRVTSKGVADIDIGAVESGYVGGMMIFVR